MYAPQPNRYQNYAAYTMPKNAIILRAHAKKLHLTDHYCTRFLTAEDLARHLHLSVSHSHKIITQRTDLKPAYQELLCYKVLGATPWTGWHFDDGKLYNPQGRFFTPNELDNYLHLLHLNAIYRQELRAIKKPL